MSGCLVLLVVFSAVSLCQAQREHVGAWPLAQPVAVEVLALACTVGDTQVRIEPQCHGKALLAAARQAGKLQPAVGLGFASLQRDRVQRH